MKKFLALLLTLSVVLCSLASCGGETAEAIIKKADEALIANPYKLNMDVKFESDSDEFAASLGLADFDVDVYFDGYDFLMAMDLMGAEMEFLCVDSTVYCSLGYLGQIISKTKSTLSNDQRKEFIGDMTSTADFGALDFENISMSTNDQGYTVIECSNLKTEALDKFLDSEIANIVDGMSLDIDNITLKAVFDNGKYRTLSISMDYIYTVDGTEHVIGYEIETEFDYEAGKELVAPSDAGDYREVDYDKLIPSA